MKLKSTSIQYMKRPAHLSLEEITHLYFDWLPTLFGGPIRVKKEEALGAVAISFFNLDLLKLERENQSDEVSFKVIGGVLARSGGRFHFSFEEDVLITGLINFSPRLPWPIYRITQYPFHDLVMFLYSQHLLTLR